MNLYNKDQSPYHHREEVGHSPFTTESELHTW